MARVLAVRRHRFVLDRLGRDGEVSVAEIAGALGVSQETVRRDLKLLAEEGRLRVVHGGASSLVPTEPDIALRSGVNAAGKAAIGRAAAALVRDGASVIIDSGTTTLAVAQALAERKRLTVYTNSLPVARLLARQAENSVVLLGGEIVLSDESTLGWDTVAMLAQYAADFAFIGVGGLTDEPAFLDYTRAGAEVRGMMLLQAKHPVLLADHTKLGRSTPVRVPNLDRAARLVTDRKLPAAFARAFAAAGIAVTVAAAGPSFRARARR